MRVRAAAVTIAVILAGSASAVGCSPGRDDGASAPPGDQAEQAAGEANPMALAEEMVAGDLAEAVGLGPLVPSCTDPGPLAVGVTFGCTGTTETGQVIRVQGIVNVEGRIQLATTNYVTPLALSGFEKAAAAQLNQEAGSNFTAESVDCGAGPVIVPGDQVLRCALIMPSNNEVFDLTLTVTNLDAREFTLTVADSPRS